MHIYLFQTMKGHTTFLFGQVSTLGLCFGFKSVIDVTLSIWFQEQATTRLACPICACIIFTQWREILCFGRVGTLGLCFGFKSVIDVTLSIWFQEQATTRLACPICACIIFTQWRDILCFVLVELARLGFVLVLKAWSTSRLARKLTQV